MYAVVSSGIRTESIDIFAYKKKMQKSFVTTDGLNSSSSGKRYACCYCVKDETIRIHIV